MSNWQEHIIKEVDLIPYRKAGGMYAKIAEEAYRAGFMAGGKNAMTLNEVMRNYEELFKAGNAAQLEELKEMKE